MPIAFLRLPEVLSRKGSSKSTHYEQIAQGLWTKPIALSRRMRGWPEKEVDIQLEALIAGKTEAEIRVLVAKLEADRKSATLSKEIGAQGNAA